MHVQLSVAQTFSEQETALTTSTSKDLIAVLQTTLDGRILDGGSDWVDSWADGLELLPPVDAFVLGAGMFSGYEHFWAAVLDDPAAATAMLGREPYPREIAYAEAAAKTEHLVVSTTLADVTWPSARIVRSIEEIRSFKRDGPGTVYVVGGPTLIASLLDADLLDELGLIVHPIVTGDSRSISEVLSCPRRLQLVAAEPAADDRVTLSYRVPHAR
jgi:dihydrofolate reductase